MNKDQLLGQWNILKGQIKTQWGKLTDDDLTEISGRRDQLLGKLQQRYGYAKEKAEEELSRFERAQTNTKTQNNPQSSHNPSHTQNQNQPNKGQQDKGNQPKNKEKARF